MPRPKNNLPNHTKYAFGFTQSITPFQALLGFSDTLGHILLTDAHRHSSKPWGFVLRCWLGLCSSWRRRLAIPFSLLGMHAASINGLLQNKCWTLFLLCAFSRRSERENSEDNRITWWYQSHEPTTAISCIESQVSKGVGGRDWPRGSQESTEIVKCP